MPRGRHRVSPPLHRLLPPLTVAGCAVAVAVLAWFAPVGQRGLVPRAMVAVAAAVACVGALLLRRWDRAAGKRVADLERARTREEWRTEERLAELESDVEEARGIRHRLEGDLRAKRSELARLRGEHAELLRRYATAESERARALEGRRRLAIEAGAAPRAISPSAGPTDPAAYRKADEALRHLARNAARQQATVTVEAARRRESAAVEGDVEEHRGRHAQQRPGRTARAVGPAPALPVREHHLVPAVAAAVLPYAQPNRAASRTQGGFDFFGVSKQAPAVDAPAVGPSVDEPPAARPEVIDLTAHDETEQLDVRQLRARS